MDEIPLEKFLSEDERCRLFHKNDLQLVTSLQQYLQDPYKEPLLFLGDKILQCNLQSDHANDQSTDTLHLYIREYDLNSNTKPHKFTRELHSVSGFDLQFKACSKDVVLIQISTEPMKGLHDTSTLLLYLNEDQKIEQVHDAPEMAEAYGSPQGDRIFFIDRLRPSLVHILDIKTCQQKVTTLSSIKEWPSQLSVKPSEHTSNEVACILSSTRELMAENPRGRLVIYDIINECIVAEETSNCFSSEILKYSHDGKIIMASSKLPCMMHFLDATTLVQLQCFTYPDFVPFIGLPFLLPEKIDYLLDAEVLDRIPTSKVVSNSRGLYGLQLKEGEMYFLHPMSSTDCKRAAVIVLCLYDTLQKSRVHLKYV